MIRVILADKHHLVRHGIRLLFEKTCDIEIIAEADNGQDAFDLAAQLQPDVLIMDISVPGLKGIQAAAQLHALGLTIQIVMLSLHPDEILMQQALKSGVRGYVPKHSITADLLPAVRAAHSGELYLSTAISHSGAAVI